MLIKGFAQVFASTVGAQDLDGGTMVLGSHPHLELFVTGECVTFCHKEVSEGKTGCVVCEGDKVLSAASS